MLKSKREGNKPFIALFLLWIGNAEIAPVSLSQWSMLFLNVLTQKHRINIIILPTDQPKIILLTVQTTTKISCFSLTAVWLPHSQLWAILNRESLTNPKLITVKLFSAKGHQELFNKVGSLSLAKYLVGFELGSFQFYSQSLNLLGHSTAKQRFNSLMFFWQNS